MIGEMSSYEEQRTGRKAENGVSANWRYLKFQAYHMPISPLPHPNIISH